jgi:hypothetical protein
MIAFGWKPKEARKLMTSQRTDHQTKGHADVSVTFNGKETKLSKRMKEQTSASDLDKLKDWRIQEEKVATFTSSETEAERPIDTTPLDWRGFNNSQTAATLVASSKKKKKRKKDHSGPFLNFIKKFWIPFLSAIVVGLGLGFTVLLVFTTHKAVTPTVKSPPAVSQGEVTGKTSSVPKTKTVSGADYQLNLQVIQMGVYKQYAGALTDQKQFEASGIHTAIVKDIANYYLFSGVALNPSDIKSLEKALIKGQKPYGKAWTIQPSQVKGTALDLQDIKTANLVIQNLIPLSVAACLNQPVDTKIMTQVKKALDQMEDPNGTRGQEKLVTLKGTLLAAYSSLNQPTPDGQKAQNALLDAIANYKVIIDSRD